MRPRSRFQPLRGIFAVVVALAIVLGVAGTMPSEAAPTAASGAATTSSPRGLDESAIRRYLSTAHGVGPSLQKECGGEAPLKDLHVSYARLLGTSEVQAIVEAMTCAMGNGGSDIVLVLHLGARRRIEPLILDDSSRAADELYAGQFRTPRLEARDGRLVRWFVKNHSADPIRREITYRWAGDRFVIDTVRDVPDARR